MIRAIEIIDKEGVITRLNLTKAVSLDVPKKMIILEEWKPGEWRLNYSKSVIADISKVIALAIRRED